MIDLTPTGECLADIERYYRKWGRAISYRELVEISGDSLADPLWSRLKTLEVDGAIKVKQRTEYVFKPAWAGVYPLIELEDIRA